MKKMADFIWMNGRTVKWQNAKEHICTHSLHYASSIFEGIRCYKLKNGMSAIFRLDDHVARLFDSWKLLNYAPPIPFSHEQVKEEIINLIKINKMSACYIRPLVYIKSNLKVLPKLSEIETKIALIVWPWGAYLGKEALEKGARAKISSYRRINTDAMPSQAKCAANYVNSMLAKKEATDHGYDEAIMLDANGCPVEGSAMNLFIVKNDKFFTAPLSAPILNGVTRDTVIHIAKARLGRVLKERLFSRDELYLADEAFFTGTAAEVNHVRSVDERLIGDGKPGPWTRRVQKTFFKDITENGYTFGQQNWLTYVK